MRAKLDHAFQTWQSYLAATLRRMQDRRELDAEADVAELATGVVAALQGGLILAQAAGGRSRCRQPSISLSAGSGSPPTWHARRLQPTSWSFAV